MQRRNFVSLGALFAVGALVETKQKDEEVVEENTVVMRTKIKGKDYALGFRLTGNPDDDRRGLNWLAHAAQLTVHPPVIRTFPK